MPQMPPLVAHLVEDDLIHSGLFLLICRKKISNFFLLLCLLFCVRSHHDLYGLFPLGLQRTSPNLLCYFDEIH